MKIIPLDEKRMVGLFGDGIEIPLRPFFGSMGVAPPEAYGRVSSAPPGIHAGNLDNKELVAGTTLFIPIHVRGALFQVGDGHAAQGNGEVCITALETSLAGRLQFIVRKDINHSPFSDEIGLVSFDGRQFEQPARERRRAAILNIGGNIIRNRDVQCDFHKPTFCLSIHPF